MPKFDTARSAGFLAIATALMVTAMTAQADTFTVDPAATRVTIRVGKAGLFAVVGHTHEVVAPAVAGTISVNQTDIGRSGVMLEFDATALKMTGTGEPVDDLPEVQRVMMSERVLDVRQYPKITFQSRRVQVGRRVGDRVTLQLDGDLTLHGVTRPVTVPVDLHLSADSLVAEGTVTVRQTDFGIRPVTAGAGTVKVKDQVEVVFQVAARR
jgi:polyisoprenoid-binding protein YceI